AYVTSPLTRGWRTRKTPKTQTEKLRRGKDAYARRQAHRRRPEICPGGQPLQFLYYRASAGRGPGLPAAAGGGGRRFNAGAGTRGLGNPANGQTSGNLQGPRRSDLPGRGD